MIDWCITTVQKWDILHSQHFEYRSVISHVTSQQSCKGKYNCLNSQYSTISLVAWKGG